GCPVPSNSSCSVGNVTISRVYYVEGIGHNLFFIGEFCNSNLEVAFCQHTCFIRNFKGVDLLTRSRGNNLYTLSLGDMMASSPISRHGVVRGLPKLKFEKDHLCSACAMGKSKKKPHKHKSEDTNQEKLYLLHMDLYGPMRVASINGKKYILVIVDYFHRFTWVKFLMSKDKAPDFIIKFLKMIQKVGISHETPVARSPHQNGVVERRNRTLIEVARTMLIYAKAPLFLWAEVVATTCYTQNRSIVWYEMKGFAGLPNSSSSIDAIINDIYPFAMKKTSRSVIAKLVLAASSEPALHEMTPATISSGLVPTLPPSTPFVPPSRSDLDILFQPIFDELLTPPPSVDYPTPEVIAPIAEVVAPVPVVSNGSPSSTNVDQDAPSPSNSQTTHEPQPLVIPNDVDEDNHDIKVAHIGNDPYFGIPIPEVHSDQYSSSDIIHTIVHLNHQISKHNSKWTKDHPLENIIGELNRPVSTRLQLHEQALFCYYDAVLIAVEPKTYKDALIQSCWIEGMQEEFNEFERLEVWELVPRPDKVMVITLKWIYKVKLDELGDNPNHVYKLKKALYGLKQAPRAWYDMLSSFLISQDFSKGLVDHTLFIRKEGKELLLVQVYGDDIIFVASTLELCDLFAKIMCLKFKMSIMGKISFFLGLQIFQNTRGIFINQSKYALESLKKYGFDSCDPVDTPMPVDLDLLFAICWVTDIRLAFGIDLLAVPKGSFDNRIKRCDIQYGAEYIAMYGEVVLKSFDEIPSYRTMALDSNKISSAAGGKITTVRNRSRIGINKWYQSLALRNFYLEDMELESTNSSPTAKLPILKLGEYKMWAMRIKQYFQIQDYALWEVIENEEKIKRKNDVKARGLLLMALPNEHQLTFSQYPDAKSMFAAIETRFGEYLDFIFNGLQKIVSRLAILGVIIAQEDLNLKFLSSLPPEWNTHVVVWMNKPEIETMSIDDLYNNFKIVEQKIKKNVGTSSGIQNLAFMTAPSFSSTNDANTTSSEVSVASPSVNTASPQVCTTSVSDNTVYAFMVKNPNGSNVLHQDLEKIHEDDLEAMDLKWQLSLLSVRAKKYYQKTCKKIFINALRSKEDQFRNQDNTRKQGNKQDTSKAMLAIDGVGFDWSDMAEEKV
ncbi:retrovirus-related pol polyprotein from transposon TNT 1-94, partial [Tanacetum coccineum]